MIEELSEISLILLLLVLSFIYSGSEVSIFSISEIDKLKLSQKKTKKHSLLLRYLSLPQKTLITILVGNMAVNLSASIIGEKLSKSVFINNPLFYSVLIMTVLVLLFGEIIPKRIAASKPTIFAKATINIINITHILFFPIIFIMNRLIRGHKELKTSSGLSKEELISAVEVSSDAGLDKISIKILKNLISHIERPVTDIMIPRSEIQVIAINEYWAVIEEFIKNTNFSTVLFCWGNIDNIVGFVLKIDLLKKRKKDIDNLLMEPLYVPESKSIFSLLRDFKEQNNFMAVVLDEYGGTSGIVTFKDILDSIFIQDIRIKQLIAEKESGVWLVHGNTKISDLNNELQLNLPTEANTVSGYIINMTGMIPSKGTILDIVQNHRIIVQKSNNKQVELLEFKKIDK